MNWSEKPPILTGRTEKDVAALRDYLFRMSSALTNLELIVDSVVTVDKDGNVILRQGDNRRGQ